jgi:tetratricopeptide (TPR) repeat protein
LLKVVLSLVISAVLSCLAATAAGPAASAQAEACYQKALKENRSNRSEQALTSINQAIQINSSKANYYWYKSVILNELDEQEQALVAADTAVRLNPKEAQSWADRGMILCKLRRFDEALKSEDLAVRLQPCASFYAYKGGILSIQKRWLEGKQAFDNAIVCQPDVVSCYYQRATCEEKLGQWNNVLKDCSITIKNDFSGARKRRALLMRAHAHLGLNNVAAAREDYRQCVTQWPSDIQIHQEAKTFYERIGDKKAAAAESASVKKIESDF